MIGDFKDFSRFYVLERLFSWANLEFIDRSIKLRREVIVNFRTFWNKRSSTIQFGERLQIVLEVRRSILLNSAKASKAESGAEQAGSAKTLEGIVKLQVESKK